jgi:Ca2+/Na+ antiporter
MMLITYFCYIMYMKFNAQITQRLCPKPDAENEYDEQNDEAHPPQGTMLRKLSVSDVVRRLSQEETERRNSRDQVELTVSAGAGDDEADDAEPQSTADVITNVEETEEDEDPFAVPAGLQARILWALSLPYMIAFRFTVPNLKVDKWKKFYFLAFVANVAWIGLLTWVMVKFAAEIGCLLNIDPALMGLVLLAAGTSVPDTIASVIVAREGEGDMAVSNAIGSNVFDILLGLGLPWTISTIVYKEPVKSEGNTVVYATAQLIIILGIVVGLLAFNKWLLTPKLGFVLFAVYFIFLIVNISLSIA